MPLTENDRDSASTTAHPHGYVRLLRVFFVRVCVVVALGVVLMLAVELFAYKRYEHGGADVLEPAVKLDLAESGSAADREYWKEFDQANKVVYHQYSLWRRAPYQGQMISIDAEGVRRSLHTRCDDKTFTIWTFGDSVMWGAGTTDADTIPSHIAQDYENAGRPVCIVNYAEKGWCNSQEVVALIELLKHAARKPDIVLFYDGGTEAFAAYQSGQADVHSNYGAFKSFLDNYGKTQRAGFSYLEQTNTYRLLRNISARNLFHHNAEASHQEQFDADTLSTDVVENYTKNIAVVDLLAKQYGFRPVFAWYPNLAVGHKELTAYEQQVLRFQDEPFPNLASFYRAVYAKSSEIKTPEFHDLEGLVDDQKDSLYIGLSHMKPEGTRVVADRLFNLLEGKGILSAPAPHPDSVTHSN